MALVRLRPPHAPRGGDDRQRFSAAGIGIEVFVVIVVAAALGGLITVGRDWASPLVEVTPVDLSLAALPKYTLFSLSRGLLAYAFSLVFTIVYGTIAARSHRAERVMIPVLDVLQSIPVLSFLPGLVVALVTLFPRWNIGLELSCVLAIFTGQVWNMTFSYHASLRAIPTEQREVARLFRFGRWKLITGLELPSAMIGLVWNSMMSMAGGWFFLTIVESFSTGSKSYRLPGLGSYMASAVLAGDGRAMAGAIVAMVLMILALDQLVWRPIVAWAERFKNEETAAAEKPTSWAYDLLRRSWLVAWLRRRRHDAADRLLRSGRGAGRGPAAAQTLAPPPEPRAFPRSVTIGISAILAVLAAWGGWKLLVLLEPVAPQSWLHIAKCLGLTGLRVIAALAIGLVWTVPVGIAIGRSPRLSHALQPVIQVAASFPAPMLFPLIAPALIGIGAGGDAVAVVLMLLGTQWYILFNVAAGATSVPQDLREAAAAFRVVGMKRFVVLYLAAVFPSLVTGLVTAAGGAWNASIVAEAVDYGRGRVAVDGIGSLIADAFVAADSSMLAASTVSLSVTLVLVNRFVWKRLYRVADARFAMNR
jgi:NitT/TauT family transport system permease protein